MYIQITDPADPSRRLYADLRVHEMIEVGGPEEIRSTITQIDVKSVETEEVMITAIASEPQKVELSGLSPKNILQKCFGIPDPSEDFIARAFEHADIVGARNDLTPFFLSPCTLKYIYPVHTSPVSRGKMT